MNPQITQISQMEEQLSTAARAGKKGIQVAHSTFS